MIMTCLPLGPVSDSDPTPHDVWRRIDFSKNAVTYRDTRTKMPSSSGKPPLSRAGLLSSGWGRNPGGNHAMGNRSIRMSKNAELLGALCGEWRKPDPTRLAWKNNSRNPGESSSGTSYSQNHSELSTGLFIELWPSRLQSGCRCCSSSAEYQLEYARYENRG